MTDIEYIEEQIAYVDEIRKELTSTGAVILTEQDVNKIDHVTQSLNTLKWFIELHKQRQNEN